MVFATLAEWMYVPRRWAGAQHLTQRLFFLLGVLVLNVAPSVYIFGPGRASIEAGTKQPGLVLGVVQFLIA